MSPTIEAAIHLAKMVVPWFFVGIALGLFFFRLVLGKRIFWAAMKDLWRKGFKP